MDSAILLGKARELLSPISTDIAAPEENRLDVIVRSTDLIKAAESLHNAKWGYLSAITGLDHIPSSVSSTDEREWAHIGEDQEQTGFGYGGSLEVLYHFCNAAAVVTLRVQLPYHHAEVPSICAIIPSATLFERELIEMFGVNVVDTPNTEHLLLPDDWPVGVYPLRKEFTGFDHFDEEKGSDYDAE